VARSNAEILQRLGATVTFSGPAHWYPTSFNQFGRYVPMDDDFANVDVLMLLRVQHERISSADNETFSVDEYHRLYGLNQARYDRLKKTAIVMHPAPVNRGAEIASDLVEANQSRIFAQMTNGVYARMAILNNLED
jgi:aspartate carbamoyltransferase catalytic subunit